MPWRARPYHSCWCSTLVVHVGITKQRHQNDRRRNWGGDYFLLRHLVFFECATLPFTLSAPPPLFSAVMAAAVTSKLTDGDVNELERQIAWHVWWHHRMPEPSTDTKAGTKVDTTPERFNMGSYAMECLIEAHVIAEAYLNKKTTAIEGEQQGPLNNDTNKEAPAPLSSNQYSERASLYELVWGALVHQESAAAGHEVKVFVESIMGMLQKLEHTESIQKLYQSIEFTPHKRVPYAQLSPDMLYRLQRLYFASMFMSVAFMSAAENFWSHTASFGRPLSACVGNATVIRMRTAYADALGGFKESCDALVAALDNPKKEGGAPAQLADALTEQDLAHLTNRITAEMGHEKTAAAEKHHRGKHLLASILIPRSKTATTAAASAKKSRRSQSVSIQPGFNPADPNSALLPVWRTPSEGRTDRTAPIEKPPTTPQLMDAVEWLLHADLFARHCWKELEAGGPEKLPLGAFVLIKSYEAPTGGPTLRTDMQLLLGKLSLPLVRSNMIVASFEALSLKTVHFDAEIRKLLAAKYVGTTQGYLKATPQDQLRAHQLCVLIYAISGMTTRRTELQANLMLGAQSVEDSSQLDLYRQCIEELTDIQFDLNTEFTGRVTPSGALYQAKRRTASMLQAETTANALLDSASA